MKELTIFTPTYNRALLLPKLYECLKNQTSGNFIWMIVDDGSTDNTEDVVWQWQVENLVEIEYYKKSNGGKHTAINVSLEECKTKLITCIDSDDLASPDCVEVILKYAGKIHDENIFGIVARCAHFDGTAFSENWPERDEVLYFLDLLYRYRYNADAMLVFKTDVVSRFRLPVFPGEKFVTEPVLYNQFVHDYRVLAIRELLLLREYFEDGYSHMGMSLYAKNPMGYLYFLKQLAFYTRLAKPMLKAQYVASYYAWKKMFKLDDPCPGMYESGILFKIPGRMMRYKKERLYKRLIDENYTHSGV